MLDGKAAEIATRLRPHWPTCTAFGLLSLMLMFLPPGAALRFRLFGSLLVHPFITFGDAAVRGGHAVLCRDSVHEISAARALELMEEVAASRNAERDASRAQEGVARLQDILRITHFSEHKLQCAQVVRTRGRQAFYEDYIQLACGTLDGVRRNHLVVNDRLMLVGIIALAGPTWSFMRPTTSPKFSISTKVPLRDLKGTVTGGDPHAEAASGTVAFLQETPELLHIRVGQKDHPGDNRGCIPANLQEGDSIWTDQIGDPAKICDDVFVGLVDAVTTDNAGFPLSAVVKMARVAGDDILFVVFPGRHVRLMEVSENDLEEARR
ncbi:MAG: hypothetical protein HN742_33375 [Lentisphaerae bacterium]|jgi:hypothetical protein|nr:hypothetical protein [Lentisphaerota bacterium]MBT5611308.1 hypothetical protein [Lentisphaerota bacterium]MBT7054789.1 hypothetical protein [Lentisphaerota bacterium]MBT7846810.1 hypothetical protein [Lentisphaerota bacterium]